MLARYLWSVTISSLPDNVMKTALALYMDGESIALPLPTHEEILVCNQATTTEEVGSLPSSSETWLPIIFIDCSRLSCCGSVPLVTQVSIEFSAFYMLRNCPIKSVTKLYDAWQSSLRVRSKVSGARNHIIFSSTSTLIPLLFLFLTFSICFLPSSFSSSPCTLLLTPPSIPCQNIAWW